MALADRMGVHAHAATVPTACPSGLDAIASAAMTIRTGEAELAIAGGADAPLTPHTVAAFIASGLTVPHNGDPESASKPFDLNRESGVLAEGAGMLDRKSTRLNFSHLVISYAVFCLKKKKTLTCPPRGNFGAHENSLGTRTLSPVVIVPPPLGCYGRLACFGRLGPARR